MLPIGHSSAGLIISQFKKPKPNLKEIIFLIISANIFDIDLLLLYLFKKPLFIHHRLPTHTPIFGLFYFLLFYLIFKKTFSKKIFKLSAISMLSHLILDNFSYLVYPSIVNHQISWFYPFYDPQKIINNNLLNLSASNYKTQLSTVTDYYLIQTPIVFYVEILLFIISLILVYKNYFKHDKKV